MFVMLGGEKGEREREGGEREREREREREGERERGRERERERGERRGERKDCNNYLIPYSSKQKLRQIFLGILIDEIFAPCW